MKKLFIPLLLLVSIVAGATPDLKITGKIRVLRPTTIRLENLRGESLAVDSIQNDHPFLLEIPKMQPDIYRLYIGTTSQNLFLTPGEIVIKGYYDENQTANSKLNFTGLEAHQRVIQWIPIEQRSKDRKIAAEAFRQLTGGEIGALAYFSQLPQYEGNRQLLEAIPASERHSLVAQWLKHRVDSLSKYAPGAQAYDFTLIDTSGKKVSLHDFRGKFILLDFWASWCGPCRREMKSLLPIYRELKGDDLEFISISMDSREKDWKNMLRTEQLPWVMLWNPEGFATKGKSTNILQEAYGFYSIPFILLIDPEGKIIARDLRGEKVKTAIQNARKKKQQTH